MSNVKMGTLASVRLLHIKTLMIIVNIFNKVMIDVAIKLHRFELRDEY